MGDLPKEDKPGPGQRGAASRLPWRYAEIGRRRLAALAGARAASPRERSSSRGGVDIDDHIRLAVREESAATLGRAGRKLQDAVAALAEFDRDRRDRAAGPAGPAELAATAARLVPARRPLLHDAAQALWEYVVQREAVGLTNHDLLGQLYGVTPELWRLMGSAETLQGGRDPAPAARAPGQPRR